MTGLAHALAGQPPVHGPAGLGIMFVVVFVITLAALNGGGKRGE
jgi:hypothetical protein